MEGCAAKRRVSRVDLPVPEGPERTIAGGVVVVVARGDLLALFFTGGGGGEGGGGGGDYLEEEEPFSLKREGSLLEEKVYQMPDE